MEAPQKISLIMYRTFERGFGNFPPKQVDKKKKKKKN